jgi:hypothetical protein
LLVKDSSAATPLVHFVENFRLYDFVFWVKFFCGSTSNRDILENLFLTTSGFGSRGKSS